MTTGSGEADVDLDEVLKKIVHLVTREYPLTGNQLHDLSSHLSRLATHRIVQEQIRHHKN